LHTRGSFERYLSPWTLMPLLQRPTPRAAWHRLAEDCPTLEPIHLDRGTLRDLSLHTAALPQRRVIDHDTDRSFGDLGDRERSDLGDGVLV
jgi:hypothetical protein